MLKGKKLKKLYHTFAQTFYEQTGVRWEFKRGEKKRIKNVFSLMASSMGARDSDEYDDVIEMVKKYQIKMTEDWLGWPSRSRSNYLGFLEKGDEIQLFVKGREVSDKAGGGRENHNLQVAGREDESDWDF